MEPPDRCLKTNQDQAARVIVLPKHVRRKPTAPRYIAGARLALDVYVPLLDAPPKQPDDAVLDCRAQRDSMVLDRRRFPRRGEIDQPAMRACHRRPIDPGYMRAPILIQQCMPSAERYWRPPRMPPRGQKVQGLRSVRIVALDCSNHVSKVLPPLWVAKASNRYRL